MVSADPARRLALLDLHARADQFQDDGSLGALAAELESAGHAVTLVRSVLASEPEGAVKWHARLERLMTDGGFELVVLARVWDAATIHAVRAGLPQGGLVVRLTNGVAAALDHDVDHVLDVDGLRRLLAGDESPTPAAFRVVAPAELRRRAVARPAALRVIAPTSLPGLDEPAGSARPTLSGPATGCPFLLDVRKNPRFAALPEDGQLQTKGCSFCLDNHGSYALPSSESVIEAWSTQLLQTRERHPNAREVLLTDERPHPYLADFFRWMLARGDVAPIELLFKSRVDWLLEFADTRLAEAAALAATHGSVLHLYLVGFESFDQEHLDLFNKGVTVADNVAAIAKLRELGARFPTSFEYRKYRAHGIVLFTPWTTPASLLENARVMRDIGFSELRSEAVRTRLRLYPRVPLHALAAHDGLLTDAFEEGRPDRASEQGYDASVPWRFRDPAVEAIFRSVTSLARVRSLPDPDLLDAATSLITRYPGLASVPDVAWLPLKHGPAVPLLEEADARGGFGVLLAADPEIELIARGRKQACLKEGVSAAEAPALCRAYRAMGFEAAVVELHGLRGGADAHVAGTDYAIVAVARDASVLSEVLAAQRGHAAGGKAVVRAMGALMGYPPCCIEAFLDQPSRGDNLENERLPFRRAPDVPLDPRLHRVGAMRLVSHHLCGPSCAASAASAGEAIAALAIVDADATAHLCELLERPVLFLDYQRRIELLGDWNEDRFEVRAGRSLGDARRLGVDPGELASLEVFPHEVRCTLRDGRVVPLPATHPLLTNPGGGLAPAARRALGPAITRPGGTTATDLASTSSPPPALPSALRPGVRAAAYRIVSVDLRGAAYEVVLASAVHRFSVSLRRHEPDRPGILRRGAWAVDLEDPLALPDAARVALGLLVRALPAV